MIDIVPYVAMFTVDEIVDDIRNGKLVVLVDDDGPAGEGNLVLAADHVSPDGINFMVRFGRGLVCLALTQARCDLLKLGPMNASRDSKRRKDFTVSVEAAQGVTTGISTADRARTIQVAVARDATPDDLVQPGHIFPLKSADGGVLARAGQTEAACDLAALAGCSPAGVCCQIMNEDGSMASLPELRLFAHKHGLRIGTISDLIAYRWRTESLIEKLGTRVWRTAFGDFTAHAFRDKAGNGMHLALMKGDMGDSSPTLTHVHGSMSVLIDMLKLESPMNGWNLDACLSHINAEGRGIVVLPNCGESADHLLEQIAGPCSPRPRAAGRDQHSWGIASQILRACGVRQMLYMGSENCVPDMGAYGMQVVRYVSGAPVLN